MARWPCSPRRGRPWGNRCIAASARIPTSMSYKSANRSELASSHDDSSYYVRICEDLLVHPSRLAIQSPKDLFALSHLECPILRNTCYHMISSVSLFGVSTLPAETLDLRNNSSFSRLRSSTSSYNGCFSSLESRVRSIKAGRTRSFAPNRSALTP